MLSVVPNPRDEARTVLWAVETLRPTFWALVELLLVPLLGVGLLLSGATWGALLIGAALALAGSRYGPPWWPGRR